MTAAIPPLPPTEPARLAALRSYAILDTPPEPVFDDIAHLAASICATPMALITLIDEARQWFKARVGLGIAETPREVAFCAHAILQPELMVVRDTRADPRFARNPYVTGEPHVRFYAGAPLVTAGGSILGTLCVLDRTPRDLTPDQQVALRVLSREVSTQLDLRRNLVRLRRATRRRRRAERRLEQLNAGLDGLVRERTAQLEAEALERRMAEGRYRELLDGVPVGLYRATVEGKIIEANPALARIFGYPDPASLMAVEAAAFYVDLAERTRWQAEIERNGEVRWQEVRRRRRDGTVIWVRKSSRAVRDHAGRVLCYEGTVEDITAQKTALDALRASEERFRALIERSGDAILLLTADAAVTFVSESVRRLLGYDSAEVLGRGVLEFIHPDDAERALGIVQEALARPGGVATGPPLRTRRKDGTWRLIEGTLANQLDHPAVGALVVNCRDVTERLALERRAALAQRYEAIARLAGGLAHDFNNLLTAVLGNAELLLASLPTEDPHREDAAEIHRAALRAAELTRQLLAFSRQQVLHPRPLDLNPLVTGLMGELRAAMVDLIEVRAQLAPDLAPALADPEQLERVILTLAEHARDAMPWGGLFTIETRNVRLDEADAPPHVAVRPGPYVLLAVGHSGAGIEERAHPHLFEPFFTTNQPGTGPGLRLATVYGIVKQSGGYIWADNSSGGGAMFRVYLPRAGEPSAAATTTTLAPTAAGAAMILLVDDQASVRKFARRVLVARGYTILEAADGADAMRVAREHPGPIALLVTDVTMPGIDGRELARRLGETRPAMKTLFVSGFVNDRELPGAFLAKPFAAEALARRVREVLNA